MCNSTIGFGSIKYKLDVITKNIDFPASDKIDSNLSYFFCVKLTRFLGNYTHIQEQWVLKRLVMDNH